MITITRSHFHEEPEMVKFTEAENRILSGAGERETRKYWSKNTKIQLCKMNKS